MSSLGEKLRKTFHLLTKCLHVNIYTNDYDEEEEDTLIHCVMDMNSRNQ